MSSFEQKRNKQVFEIIVILKIIYIILSMIAISGFYNFNKESNNVILIPVMFSAVLITMLVYFSWTVVYIKDKIDKPNDVLALEYVRSIINLKSKIKPISIKRTNNYNDTNINDKITSASSIRKNISNKELIINTLPKKSYDLINNINYDDFFKYLKYEILTNDNLNDILDVDEGIENKLKKEIISVDKLEDLILKVKSKRYSYNRIKRMLLHILTKTKKDYDKEVKYIRVLGMNLNGMKILKEAKKNSNLQIVTKFKKEYYKLFEDDIKASKLYSLLTKYDVKRDFSKPIIKD